MSLFLKSAPLRTPMLHVSVHAACPHMLSAQVFPAYSCPCCFSTYGHGHGAWLGYAAWIWTSGMNMDMHHGHGHAAFTGTCSMDMTMQNVAWTWTGTISMYLSMLHVSIHAACPNSCRMSMLHGRSPSCMSVSVPCCMDQNNAVWIFVVNLQIESENQLSFQSVKKIFTGEFLNSSNCWHFSAWKNLPICCSDANLLLHCGPTNVKKLRNFADWRLRKLKFQNAD